MIDYTELREALRDRLLTTPGVTSAMCAWINPSHKELPVYLEADFVPARGQRVTMGDEGTNEVTGLLVPKIFGNAAAGADALYDLATSIIARYDLTWSAALSGNTYVYIDGRTIPVPAQALPAIGNRLYTKVTIAWLVRTRNAVAA